MLFFVTLYQMKNINSEIYIVLCCFDYRTVKGKKGISTSVFLSHQDA